MPRPTRCIVENCPNPSHAKGYCRRHYGQIWRRGVIYDTTPRDPDNVPVDLSDPADRLRTLERELKRAQEIYAVVVGFQGRVKWRREIEAVQAEMNKVIEAQAAQPTLPQSVDAPGQAPSQASNASLKESKKGTEVMSRSGSSISSRVAVVGRQ